MASSDEESVWDWREHVEFPGIDEVSRSEQSSFIARNRGVIQQTLREALSSLQSAFPEEFGNIKGVRDPDDLAAPLQEIVNSAGEDATFDIRIPAGVAEFLTLTFETAPSATAEFGLPTVSPVAHPSRPGLMRIELDYDEEVDVRAADEGFWIASAKSTSKKRKDVEFGKVYYGAVAGSPAFKPVAPSFEDFFVMWQEFMCDEFKLAQTDDERRELLDEFYSHFADE
ncbi:hypothetical protein DFJ77DRAFT_139771 [Powellomyces hirtus]|nr:hypothetical protein DFJ77DRAFT_139771 [Powellomyces hirtus]